MQGHDPLTSSLTCHRANRRTEVSPGWQPVPHWGELPIRGTPVNYCVPDSTPVRQHSLISSTT